MSVHMVLYIMSKNSAVELFFSATAQIDIFLHIITQNLDWAFTEAFGGLVSCVEALFGSNASPTAVWVETKLEAARGLDAICENILVMLNNDKIFEIRCADT